VNAPIIPFRFDAQTHERCAEKPIQAVPLRRVPFGAALLRPPRPGPLPAVNGRRARPERACVRRVHRVPLVRRGRLSPSEPLRTDSASARRVPVGAAPAPPPRRRVAHSQVQLAGRGGWSIGPCICGAYRWAPVARRSSRREWPPSVPERTCMVRIAVAVGRAQSAAHCAVLRNLLPRPRPSARNAVLKDSISATNVLFWNLCWNNVFVSFAKH
jgi:hypothetical protein